MTKIIYTYKDCSAQDFEADRSFNETNFDAILQPAFETKVRIEKVNIEFELISHPEHPKLLVHAYIDSPDMKFKGLEEGFEYSEVARKLLHQVVEEVRKAKSKKIS